ncbi:MAG: nucleotide exchange factor GrpE, partial [Thermoplasmata archaeon]
MREEDEDMPKEEEPVELGDGEVVSEPTPEEQLLAEKDRYLRLAAEFDNYRKRAERDMAEYRKRATESVLLSVLDVVDNLDRALETSDTCSMEDLVTGLQKIRNQMGNLLQRE